MPDFKKIIFQDLTPFQTVTLSAVMVTLSAVIFLFGLGPSAVGH